MGLTAGQIETALENFPDHLKIMYKYISSPPNDWDENIFGRFQPLTLIRAKIPPSNRCSTSSNHHHPVIGFGTTPQDQLGLRDPYRVIYYWRCMNCSSLNGALSFCRHLAALLVSVSFPYFYRSASRGVSLLNSVIERSLQVLDVLPRVRASVPIPQNVMRRSNNTRTTVGGALNPLYDTTVPSSVGVGAAPSTASTTTGTTSSSTAPSTAPSPSPSTTPSTATSTPPPAPAISPQSSPAYHPPSPATTRPALQSSVRVSVPVWSGVSQIVQMNRTRNQLVTCPLLRQYIAGLNLQMQVPPLPPPSTVQLPNAQQQFAANHLQFNGIINDDNTCCLLSFVLCCHRMNLRSFFPQVNQILQHNTGLPDYASILFLEILKALPSNRAFSVSIFMPVWNSIHPGTPLGQNEDIVSISELLISSLPLLPQSNIRVLTEFNSQYDCLHCGHQARHQRDWISKSFHSIPILNIDQNNNPVPVGTLLSNLLATQFNVVCGSCGQHTMGQYHTRRGHFTLLRLNRILLSSNNNQQILSNTRLSMMRTPAVAEQYLGHLVSCISHSGSIQGGHYRSYHCAGRNNNWYCNDDDRQLSRIRHPFDVRNENVVFLVYSNH